jgi:hypothetical protein
MNFEHRPLEQRELIAKILSYDEAVVIEAQGELKFAVGVHVMSLWTPSLVVLLEVCGHIKGKTIKRWREEQANRAARELGRIGG